MKRLNTWVISPFAPTDHNVGWIDTSDEKGWVARMYNGAHVEDVPNPTPEQLGWDPVAGITEEEIKKLLDAKQDTLVSGENIKTLSNKDLLGEGNIAIKLTTNASTPNVLRIKLDSDTASSQAFKTINGETLLGEGDIITPNTKSIYRGGFADLGSLPVLAADYVPDAEGNRTPQYGDYTIVFSAGTPEWDPNEEYYEGDLINYEDVVYVCIADVWSSEYPYDDPTHWRQWFDWTLSEQIPYTGCWRFIYRGNFSFDSKWGWAPEYKVEPETVLVCWEPGTAPDSAKMVNASSVAEARFAIAGNEKARAKGYNSTAFGGAEATGQYSFAAGKETTRDEEEVITDEGAVAASRYSAAFNAGKAKSKEYAFAINKGTALGTNSFAQGENTVASGNKAVAFGVTTTASGDNTFARGKDTLAKGAQSVAEGEGSEAFGARAHAAGYNTIAAGANSFTTGKGQETLASFTISGEAKATTFTTDEEHGLSVGDVIKAEVDAANPVALVVDVPDDYTITLDKKLSNSTLTDIPVYIVTGVAYGGVSTMIGDKCNATGESSFAEGKGTIASGVAAHVEGADNLEGTYEPEEGEEKLYAKAEGYASHAEGAAHAIGSYSHAEGGGSTIVSGKKTVPTAEGEYSHAEGTHTYALGFASHAEGSNTIASGENGCSHAEGYNTTASGDCSHAEGSTTQATQVQAHAEGYNTTASGSRSHAEGEGTIAQGSHSHAEGLNNTAKGSNSHAEGEDTYTNGSDSHAEGLGTRTENKGEHAEGKYNKSNTGTRHSVGIGTADDNRKNAFEIMQNGDAYLLNVGTYDGTNPTSGTNDVATIINSKQAALVSGTNIKTINNESLLGSGNIDIGGSSDAVPYYDTTKKSVKLYGGFPKGNGSLTLGAGRALGEGSLTMGTASNNTDSANNSIQATAAGCFAGGYSSINGGIVASGPGSMAFGHSAVSGRKIQATGNGTIAMGSTALGTIEATGNFSIAIGSNTHATAAHTYAIGWGNTASYSGATAIGNGANASGENSIAISGNATALCSKSIGGNANGDYSVSIGHGVVASRANSVAIGRLNSYDSNTQFSIGAGTSASARSNLIEVYNDEFYVKGVGGYTGSNASTSGINSVNDLLTPLVVQGPYDSTLSGRIQTFTPDSGQPTYAEAKAAFLAGRPVILHLYNTSDYQDILVTNYDNIDDGLAAHWLLGDKVYFWDAS